MEPYYSYPPLTTLIWLNNIRYREIRAETDRAPALWRNMKKNSRRARIGLALVVSLLVALQPTWAGACAISASLPACGEGGNEFHPHHAPDASQDDAVNEHSGKKQPPPQHGGLGCPASAGCALAVVVLPESPVSHCVPPAYSVPLYTADDLPSVDAPPPVRPPIA